MKIRTLSLLVAAALTMPATAQDMPASVYQQYERAYLANNYQELAKWLSDDADLSQTLHVGDKADTLRVSKDQMLESMRNMGRPSQIRASDPNKVQISDLSQNGFCAMAETVDETEIDGQNYQERESRKACFVREGNAYRVRLHAIDVYYLPAK